MPNKQLNFMDYYIAQLFIIARINKIEIACDGTILSPRMFILTEMDICVVWVVED
jgi:hypothetical protein